MIDKKSILSLTITMAMISSQLSAVPIHAFEGYDDYSNYNYNNYSTTDYYGQNDYYSYTTEPTDDMDAIQIVQPDEETLTDLEYTISNDQVTIVSYDETVNFSYYTLPSIIEGYPVTAIAESAFKDCTSLVSIVIPNTVKTVGSYAFDGCKNLTSVTFENETSQDSEDEDGMQDDSDIYGYGYYDSSDDDESDGDTDQVVTYSYDYNDNAYYSYDYNSYGYNYSYDYSSDDDDEGDDTDDGYSYDYYSYDYYSNSTDDAEDDEEDDTYSSGYGYYDYSNYGSDDEEDVTTTVDTSEDDEEETTTTTEEEEDIAVNPVQSYTSTLAEGVEVNHTGITAIMEHAFGGCSKLSEINVPDTLSYLGTYAIEDTLYYTSHIESNESVILGGVYYKYCPTYTYTYEYNEETTKYDPIVNPFDEEIPEGIVSISYSAFANVEGLTNLTMPESLKTIYDNAFYGCTELTDISFYDGIQYVGTNAFYGTVWLDECQGGFAIAGDYLHKYVGKGGSVTIPSKVKIIGNEAFALNTSVTRVVVQEGTQKIMGGAFYRCENLQTLVVAGSVLSIGNQAFYGCKNLNRINFSEGLLSIGEKCFVSCTSLTYAIIPSSVTQLGDMCFGFDYDDIHVSYAIVDGFTLVGDVGSTVQGYADTKMINFESKETFVVPKAVTEYEVVSDDEDVETSNTLDTKIVVLIIVGLIVLLVILSTILYLLDKKKNPNKYKKKRRRKKKISKHYAKYLANVKARQDGSNDK